MHVIQLLAAYPMSARVVSPRPDRDDIRNRLNLGTPTATGGSRRVAAQLLRLAVPVPGAPHCTRPRGAPADAPPRHGSRAYRSLMHGSSEFRSGAMRRGLPRCRRAQPCRFRCAAFVLRLHRAFTDRASAPTAIAASRISQTAYVEPSGGCCRTSAWSHAPGAKTARSICAPECCR